MACVHDLVDFALRCENKNPRFAYIAPLYKQAKDVAWTYLKEAVAPLMAAGLAEANESELRIDFWNGGRVRLYGADNPDPLRGIYLDGVILDEYADMNPRTWGEVVRPALSDRKGWAVFIGTPKGRNAFFDVYDGAVKDPKWFDMMLRASETSLIDDEELGLARKDMTPGQYAQEYECSFEAAIAGAYFGKEIADAERDRRICDVPYDPELEVHTVWDLGIGDSTAIWFWQAAGNEIRVIDFYENSGFSLGHYAKVLESKPYKYKFDWVPHDAKVRELGTGRTRIETLQGLGRKPRLIPAHKIDDGINAARVLLPRMYFDEVKCRDGIEALRQYRADFDEKNNVFRDRPLHDWTSHAADAFRYLAMGWREIAPKPAKPEEPRTMQTMTMNDAWKTAKPEERGRI